MADTKNVVPSSCSPSKSIPQSIINNVLAVCPDVDPKDVAKDLVITGSATRTINRILDGQFPAAVKVDFESMPSEISSEDETRETADLLLSKCSTVSKKIIPVDSNDDSSDTEKYTDTDDGDDDITILHEECKSLFSVLNKRVHPKQPEDKYAEAFETLELHKDIGIFSEKEFDSSLRKQPVNTIIRKRTNATVDPSFSDEDNNLDVRKQTGHKIKKHSSSTVSKTTIKSTKANHENKVASKLGNWSQMEKNIWDSPLRVHVSDNDSGSCEDSDEFSCSLASSRSRFPHGETSSRSGVPSLCSGSLYSQDSSEVPLKKKKRSKEEIVSQRNEALLRKQAKELERQAKKEAKEREKQERQQVKEQMKMQKEREKLLKKADSMNQKTNNRLDNCIKQILVCIDPEILNGGQLLEESLLVQTLESLDADHKFESQLIPASISWKRALVEHDVAETLQISTKTSFMDEKYVLVRLTAEKFVQMVFHFREEIQNPVISVITEDETLSAFCQRILAIHPGKIVTLVIMELEKYFRDVKLSQTRQFRSAVLGSSSSDSEKPSGKKRKKASKGCGPSVLVSRVDVEEALVDLQIRQPNCRVRMCETEDEFAELLVMFTKAVAEAPFKKKQPESFSFCVEGGEKTSVKVSKEGEGLKKVWLQHFQQFRNVSADMAAAIVALYPTPQSLLQAYTRCGSRVEATKLLQDILVRRGAGVLANSRRIGPELSRRVFLLLTSEDGNMPVK